MAETYDERLELKRKQHLKLVQRIAYLEADLAELRAANK